MRCGVAWCSFLFLCASVAGQESHLAVPAPTQFEIGRLTYFDFGPPFDYYEVFIVQPAATGVSVNRVTLTPGSDHCVPQPTIEFASASLPDSVDYLLTPNPCAIPEKKLNRERKRCKKCLRYSGQDITMRVQCGSQQRLIRAAVLESDIFELHPNTPEHTSWIRQLLGRLDAPLGPGVMDKPAFPFGQKGTMPTDPSDPRIRQEIAAGTYDPLFQTGGDKPSQLIRGSGLVADSAELVELKQISLLAPDFAPLPAYPPLARVTRTRGSVTVTMDVSPEGLPSNIAIDRGHPLLRAATQAAVAQWKFPQTSTGARVTATIAFDLHCTRDPDR
jgi:TonB family protein